MGKSAMTPQAMTQAARSLRRFPTTRARLAPPSYSSTRDVTSTRNLAAGTRTILLLEHVQFRWKLIMLQILCLVAFSTENRYPLFLKML
jgi:hypothetical protein